MESYGESTYNNWFPGVRLLFLWNNSYWGVNLKLSKIKPEETLMITQSSNIGNHMYEEKKCNKL